jgi:hypothetical protein
MTVRWGDQVISVCCDKFTCMFLWNSRYNENVTVLCGCVFIVLSTEFTVFFLLYKNLSLNLVKCNIFYILNLKSLKVCKYM